MSRLFRNPFLRGGLLVALLILLGGCAARQEPRPPVAEPVSPPPAILPSAQAIPFMGHAIQVGAFAQVDNAIALSARLRERGLAAYYYRNDKGLYRVRFGNYRHLTAAQAAARQLHQAGVIEVYDVIRPESHPAVRHQGREEVVRQHLVAMARQFIGVPYNLGDARPGQGFDCSGLTMMVYQLVGLEMPRVAKEQFRLGRDVARPDLRPGDLVFFRIGPGGQASHVGIYQGEGRFIHAPSSGKTVSEAQLSAEYFQRHYLGARTYL